MKKILPALFCFLICLSGFAQSPVAIPRQSVDKAVWVQSALSTDDLTQGNAIPVTPIPDPSRDFNEFQAGTTTYDKQSNYMVSNRIYFYPEDHSIGCVWTKGEIPDAFDDRGTAYNYYDGTSWQPAPEGRVEDQKSGWGCYAPMGPDGEVIVAHLAQGLILSKRSQKGTGEWMSSPVLEDPADPTWPRIITSGVSRDTLHILASSYDPYSGQDKALLYFRSPDGGDTWDIPGIILEGTGSDSYTFIQNDSYAWAEPRGNTLAFVVTSAWHDMFIMKSTDGGDSWEKTIIWENPYPFFDFDVTLTDTFFCPDNSAAIALDDNGRAHVAFGINRVRHSETGTSYWLYYLVDGIGYWNEDMPAFSDDLDALSPPQYEYPHTELVEDYNYVGWSQDMDGNGELTFLESVYYYNTIGISTMPSISVDEEGRIFIVYSSTTENYDNFEYNYKHIWARAWSEESGWTGFVHVSADVIHMFDECIYPEVAANSDDYIHLMYQTDNAPGTAVDEEHDFQENRIVYARVNKFEFYPWSTGDPKINGGALEVSQNYPNPCTETTNITVFTRAAGQLTIDIRNLCAQTVMSLDLGHVIPGTHSYVLDVDLLPGGVYFYVVRQADQSVSRKMIIR